MPAITLPALGLWMGIASLIFGVIVMIFPKILNYLVGIYLIMKHQQITLEVMQIGDYMIIYKPI